jgi:hypothetical protein
VLRCTVRVNDKLGSDSMDVRLTAAVIANGVVVHRHRWSSARETRVGGFTSGDAVAIDVNVPPGAPASRCFSAGSLEWSVEAACGDVVSEATTAVITSGVRRRPVDADSSVERGVPWFAFVLKAAIVASVLYPATLVSRSIGSPWPTVAAAAVVIAAIGMIVINARRKEPFPFRITESAVRRGGALQIELDDPSSIVCTARLVATVDRVESSGDYYDSDRRVVDGPITKIDPGVRRTVVAVPADTPAKSIVSLGPNTDIITRHFVEIVRYGAPERSLRRKPVSRRSIDVRD